MGALSAHDRFPTPDLSVLRPVHSLDDVPGRPLGDPYPPPSEVFASGPLGEIPPCLSWGVGNVAYAPSKEAEEET